MTKIMVVDDDKGATALFEQVLLMAGFESIVVNESSKAVEMAVSTHPNLFLIDLMMPEPDGFRLCRMLRAQPSFRRTPIVIVTALNDLDSRLVAMGAGASGYLTKPFHIHQLLSILEEHLPKQP
ncbi:MAG: response regulator [Chloroflexota bacterium]